MITRDRLDAAWATLDESDLTSEALEVAGIEPTDATTFAAEKAQNIVAGLAFSDGMAGTIAGVLAIGMAIGATAARRTVADA